MHTKASNGRRAKADRLIQHRLQRVFQTQPELVIDVCQRVVLWLFGRTTPMTMAGHPFKIVEAPEVRRAVYVLPEIFVRHASESKHAGMFGLMLNYYKIQHNRLRIYASPVLRAERAVYQRGKHLVNGKIEEIAIKHWWIGLYDSEGEFHVLEHFCRGKGASGALPDEMAVVSELGTPSITQTSLNEDRMLVDVDSSAESDGEETRCRIETRRHLRCVLKPTASSLQNFSSRKDILTANVDMIHRMYISAHLP